MTWFEELAGFREDSPADVRRKMAVEGEALVSRVDGRELRFGRLETPSLGELRERVSSGDSPAGGISVRQVVADVRNLHANTENTGALFQAASQFNLLEMAGPSITPEDGVGIYENDRTQGPACAIACGAGTIYRNYFAPVNGQLGQSRTNQIDCLADLGVALGNPRHRLWEMKNGYALASAAGLREISEILRAARQEEQDTLRKLLRIGLQWNPRVTLGKSMHTVSQAYCSALPIAYGAPEPGLWEPFAKLVLEAAYEATLCAGIVNARAGGTRRVYLTLLGGGAFGNLAEWIVSAMLRALEQYSSFGLDIAIVSHGAPNAMVQRLVRRFTAS